MAADLFRNLEFGILESGIWNSGIWNSGIWNLDGIWNLEFGILESGIWNSGIWNSGIWNLDGIWNLESGIWNLEFWNLESGILESQVQGGFPDARAGKAGSPSVSADAIAAVPDRPGVVVGDRAGPCGRGDRRREAAQSQLPHPGLGAVRRGRCARRAGGGGRGDPLRPQPAGRGR